MSNEIKSESPSTSQEEVIEFSLISNQVNVEDFSKMCRACATVTDNVIPIFHGEGLQNNLAEKIRKHLPIEVSEQDVLPRAVCSQCMHTLLAWHELVSCCEQADRALRRRIAIVQQSQDITFRGNKQDGSENIQQRKYEFEPPPPPPSQPPPRYSAPLTTTCVYCNIQLPEHGYKEHVRTVHSQLVFHCDQCESYVNRKELIPHMTMHANAHDLKDVNKVITENESDSSAEHQAFNGRMADIEMEIQVREDQSANTENNQENEFSDHSDTENGFEPLPESVFEAIEDSQDILQHDNYDSVDNESGKSDDVQPSKENKPKHKKSRTCPICYKVYEASSSFFYHMKYFHKRSKEHECEVCGRKFGTKASLREHASIHTGECELQCKHCVKRFRSKASLYIHEQTHDGVKTWVCEQCQTSFRWRGHLARHMKRHSAEKIHVCSTCGRGFSIKYDLLRHTRTHSAGNFSCDKCGAKFAQLRYLTVHMKKH